MTQNLDGTFTVVFDQPISTVDGATSSQIQDSDTGLYFTWVGTGVGNTATAVSSDAQAVNDEWDAQEGPDASLNGAIVNYGNNPIAGTVVNVVSLDSRGVLVVDRAVISVGGYEFNVVADGDVGWQYGSSGSGTTFDITWLGTVTTGDPWDSGGYPSTSLLGVEWGPGSGTVL